MAEYSPPQNWDFSQWTPNGLNVKEETSESDRGREQEREREG